MSNLTAKTAKITAVPIAELSKNDQVSLGTINKILGKGSTLTFTDNNLKNRNKRIYFRAVNAEETAGLDLFCSARLSEMLRDGEIPDSEIEYYPITREYTRPNPATLEYDEQYPEAEMLVINLESNKVNKKNDDARKVSAPKTVAELLATAH